MVFPISDGVNPDRPDDIRPHRPSGRIFHAMHEISGLTTIDKRRGRRFYFPLPFAETLLSANHP
jgi:hypothetical protein